MLHLSHILTRPFAPFSESIMPADNGTAPEFQSWTAEPNTPVGTASVIWQCLTTIALCTYVMIHVDVPRLQLDGTGMFVRKSCLVLCGLICPEWSALKAVTQLVAARRLVRDSRRLGCSLSLKQAFFVLSGGIAFQGLQKHVPKVIDRCKMDEAIAERSDSLSFRDPDYELLDEEIELLARNTPSDTELDDRSKQDALVKGLTSAQALWFLVQTVARAQQGLVIAPLQVATLAYISMAAFISGCWWHKPYDVRMACILDGCLAIKKALPSDAAVPIINTSAWTVVHQSGIRLRHVPGEAMCEISIIATAKHKSASTLSLFGILAILFSAIHCAAWSYIFPTSVETWLWRALTCGAMLSGVWIAVIPYIQGLLKHVPTRIHAATSWSLVALYLLSRLYISIESIIAFRWAPHSVYEQAEWSAYIPHIGT